MEEKVELQEFSFGIFLLAWVFRGSIVQHLEEVFFVGGDLEVEVATEEEAVVVEGFEAAVEEEVGLTELVVVVEEEEWRRDLDCNWRFELQNREMMR